MAAPDVQSERTTQCSGWQAFCAVARAISASNDNTSPFAPKSKEELRDAQRS